MSDDCQTLKRSDVGADGSGGGFTGRCDVRLSTTIINHLTHITKNDRVSDSFPCDMSTLRSGIVSRSNILNLSHVYLGCKLTDHDFFCHVGLVREETSSISRETETGCLSGSDIEIEGITGRLKVKMSTEPRDERRGIGGDNGPKPCAEKQTEGRR